MIAAELIETYREEEALYVFSNKFKGGKIASYITYSQVPEYLKKAKWKDDLYVEVRIKNNDVDDNCFSYAYQGNVDEIPLYCLTKHVVEIDGKVLNSHDEGNVPCVVITLSDEE